MQTQLYAWHAENGDIVDFAGFQMPVMYTSIIEEHMAVRNAVGLFDVSHMGRMWIQGKDSEKFLNALVPRDLSKTNIGRASYTFMLNELGGFRDDLVFERIEENKWLLVWNAGNYEKILHWIKLLSVLINDFSKLEIEIINISPSSAMYALQGPKAEAVLKRVIPENASPPSSWNILQTTIGSCDVIVSGTGYTGESGYEIIVFNTSNEENTNAVNVWMKLLVEGKQFNIKPCGLGARDSLRLEAGYHLYGNDISESINPLEADLFFPPFIHINKSSFIGKPQLEILKEKPLQKIRVGLISMKRGPSPRSGLKLFQGEKEIGVISSGGFSPILNIGIGMGYILPEYNIENEIIQFQVRNKMHEVKIQKYPLYDPDMYGKSRKD
ncbi:glycine cleavage system protein T [Candidatus Heimdallarchaeota archaeon B3_Heim]|nr:MAG: glycine cleavage system protein T [Candidatus Heimdallarchaeota archaeon B3_Heim]